MAVTVDDVRLIFETPMEDVQLQEFLDQAQELVDQELVSAGHSQERLDAIVKNLAAHFGSVITPFTQREKIGRDYEMWRFGSFGEGLKSTAYGQTALILDTSGILSSAGKKQRITFRTIDLPQTSD